MKSILTMAWTADDPAAFELAAKMARAFDARLVGLEPPSYEVAHRLLTHPVTRLYLFVLIALPLFHWAHRFRYTLYDGLQLKHLTALIAVLCYGAALLGTAMTAYLLWNVE